MWEGLSINLNMFFFTIVSLAGYGDSLVSDGSCKQYTQGERITHANIFSRVAQGPDEGGRRFPHVLRMVVSMDSRGLSASTCTGSLLSQ